MVHVKMEHAMSLIRNTEDFPRPGQNYKDFGFVINDCKAVAELRTALYKQLNHLVVTKILIIESSSYFTGTLLAQDLEVGFVPIRKQGRLPGKCLQITFDQEQKKGQIFELQEGIINSNDTVIIHDDILTTGETIQAAITLAIMSGVEPQNIYISVIAQRPELNGIQILSDFNKFYCLFDI